MRILPFVALGAFALALSTIGCSADAASDDASETASDAVTQGEVVATDADANKTIKVTEGETFVLKLGSNATTGYKWKVAKTDRTFAYPFADDYVGPGAGGPVGGGGKQVLKWSTEGASDAHGTPVVSKVGKHQLTIEYRRPWEPAETCAGSACVATPAAKTFKLTVEVVARAEPANEDVVATIADNGKTVKVTEGDAFVLQLGANATTGYKWKVTKTNRTFAYPVSDDYEEAAADGPVGSGGMQILTWSTDAVSDAHGTPVVSKVGKHQVTVEYRRPWEPATTPAAETFKVTVNVVAR